MATVTVYQFKMYDINNDGYQKSRRWGTSEVINKLVGTLIDGTGVVVDDAVLDRELPGFSERGYDPHAFKRGGFQNVMR